LVNGQYSGGANQPFYRDGSIEGLNDDPTVRPHPKVWTEVKNGSAKDGTLERLKCRTIQEAS